MKFCVSDETEFDIYYVLKVVTDCGERYFFSPRLFVYDVGLAKKFNTLRSVRRSAKLCGLNRYKVEKLKRAN